MSLSVTREGRDDVAQPAITLSLKSLHGTHAQLLTSPHLDAKLFAHLPRCAMGRHAAPRAMLGLVSQHSEATGAGAARKARAGQGASAALGRANALPSCRRCPGPAGARLWAQARGQVQRHDQLGHQQRPQLRRLGREQEGQRLLRAPLEPMTNCCALRAGAPCPLPTPPHEVRVRVSWV